MIRSLILVLLVVMIAILVAPPQAHAYEGDPEWDDCELCERYQVGWACWNCLIDMWWQGDGCFPGDPDCY